MYNTREKAKIIYSKMQTNYLRVQGLHKTFIFFINFCILYFFIVIIYILIQKYYFSLPLTVYTMFRN